jgi:hypothetical protein
MMSEPTPMKQPSTRISKAEVSLVVQYSAIVSTDKLIEALAFPLITSPDHEAISAELALRLRRLDRNQPHALVRR